MISRRFSLKIISFLLLLWRQVLLNHSSFNISWLAWRMQFYGSATNVEPWFFLKSHAQDFFLKRICFVTWYLAVLYFFYHFAIIVILDIGAKCIKGIFFETINDLTRSLLLNVLHRTGSHESITDIQQKA
jgi:hypothetical protein